jgi:hypothetical protein
MKGLINHSLYSTVTLVFLLWFTPILGQVPTPEVAIQLAFQQSKTQAVQDPLIQRNNALNKVFQ